MDLYYCPHCHHCQVRKQKLSQEEDERAKAKEIEAKEAREKEIREGKIYGHAFDLYSLEDLKNITDIDFLYEMASHVIPCGQPETEWEQEIMYERYDAVHAQISLLEDRK